MKTKKRPTRTKKVSPETAWVRNPSDEEALRNGCRFDWRRGAYTVWWIERHCKLYEGEQAGQPVVLHGCHQCAVKVDGIMRPYGLEVPLEWNEEAERIGELRSRLHEECYRKGHTLDWQYECTMRKFGWVKWSTHWQEEIRRFRKSWVFIAKKNKKSPTMASETMYLTCGDGEQGQHVYMAAKDGAQVRDNGMVHIKAMLESSPELSEECTFNLTKMSLSHEPTLSDCKPLSSANKRSQESKEGLNGSVEIDEVHVVERRFVKRIDRAGISRKEPFVSGFSTSGDDPDSYGKEVFDRCLKIISGEIIDEQTFAAVYAAPQDLTDADLDADPLKYARMANPAMGHTVDPEELLADYNSSKESALDLAICKMYRFNIWQHAAIPWLKMDKWDSGKRPFTYESMKGRECWSSLDLASVSDFASLCLCFPEEEEETHRYLWWFWLPEETSRAVQHKIPIQNWLKDERCRLILTPGARIHYGAIRSAYRDLATQYDIQELAYDDWNAEQTSQELSEGVTNHAGVTVEPATGIPRVNFGQGIKDMNEPTKKFEGSVIDGMVHHNGDPIARWMAQNATIKADVNGNYKPLKSADLSKKIDGVVTAIMARARAVIGCGGFSSYYDDDENEVESF